MRIHTHRNIFTLFAYIYSVRDKDIPSYNNGNGSNGINTNELIDLKGYMKWIEKKINNCTPNSLYAKEKDTFTNSVNAQITYNLIMLKQLFFDQEHKKMVQNIFFIWRGKKRVIYKIVTVLTYKRLQLIRVICQWLRPKIRDFKCRCF